MWVSIIGPSGSGKGLIASTLKNLKFTLSGDGSAENSQYYFTVDKVAAEKMYDEDIFTIGSMWDFHECKVPFYHQIYQTNDFDKEMQDNIYSQIKGVIHPPSFVVYTKITKALAHDRLLLTGEGEQLLHNIQIQLDLYDDFITRVSVPVIELDMSKGDKVIDDLLFGVDSIRSTRLGGQSIWKMEMMRE